MSQPLFRGAGVALLTLFDDNGAVLPQETAQFAATLAGEGAACILVAGTTGEFWTLTPEERLDVIAAARQAVPGDVPVLAGIGALERAQALQLAAEVAGTGADAALCFAPKGEDPAAFLRDVRQAVERIPLLAYHFPAVGYEPLPLDVLADLPIEGIKDSSGDPSRFVATQQVLASGVYTGSALLASLAAAIDASGVILALGNVAPDAAARAVGGDLDAQRELARLHTAISGDVPPRAIKRLAAERYGIPPFFRTPSLAETSRR